MLTYSNCIMNIDIVTCIASGIAIGVASIYVSSMFPPLKMSEDEESNEDNGNERNRYQQDSQKEMDSSIDREQIDSIVENKMRETLIKTVPKHLLNEDDINDIVNAASKMKGEGEEINIFVILSWILFIIVLCAMYYLLNIATQGGITRMLIGFFPREFAFFGVN